MQIQFCGAAQTVTGSQILITVNGKKILLECGLFQGRRQETYEKNHNFIFDPSEVDLLILSHAHIDHSGNIPNLVRQGFKGSIYATPATIDLCKIMLRDSAFLQEKDLEWVNKIRRRQHLPEMEPLYSMRHVEAAMDQFVGIDFDRGFTIAPGVEAMFRDAGHILGSAGIHLEINEDGEYYRLGFTGDIGRPDMPLTHDPNVLRDLDILIMECTYGNRHHGETIDIEEELASSIRDTAAIGGKIIIPSFAVGRTQQLVYFLHKLFNQNRIPDMPVYVDSPLACNATEVFRSYPNYLDRETKRVFLNDHEDPFGFRRLTYIHDVNDSKKLNGQSFPHIIISGSGMAEGGRILHHLRNNIHNQRNLLLFVGFAAKDTLARKIMDGNKQIKIFGEEHTVRCKVKVMDAFSAHADRRELLDYVSLNTPERLKHIYLIHGEPDQALSFKDGLRSKGFQNVHYPTLGECVEISKPVPAS
ncbi:MBL fold metallo-hydrolase [Chitinispirillales bacterium ANBcel5]|uniref:MBL fold metallo-hydrolase RNA specificity domain-containing protein n=1 Tax=Cellulosispirillum alkaliphilum TaxID=3039283 RepID=UPI002A4F0CE9|nr:MBL fold metallo-hydrolase [Chitinispirillales bacterium ANBcel5]